MAGTSYCQWDLIGEDRAPISVIQVDSFLYGDARYGFYRSSDDGESWVSIDRGLPEGYQYDRYPVRFDGVDLILEAELYVGAPKYYVPGYYVLHPSDNEWKFYDKQGYDGIFSEYSKRISENVVFAIKPPAITSDTSAIYYTSDRGISWEKRSPERLDTTPAEVIAINHHEARIFATVEVVNYQAHHDTKLYHSDDWGLSWTENSINPLLETNAWVRLQVISSKLLVAQIEHLELRHFKSTDKGDTWLPFPEFDSLGAMLPRNVIGDQHFILFAHNMVLTDSLANIRREVKTVDGQGITYIFKRNTGDGYFALTSKTGWCILDTNFHITRIPAFQGCEYPSKWLLHVKEDTLFGLDASFYTPINRMFDSIYISYDNGMTWEKQRVSEGFFLSERPWIVGKNYFYTTGSTPAGSNTFLRSSDQGKTWKATPLVSSIYDLKILAHDGDTLVTFNFDTLTGKSYQITYDGGATWQSFDLPHYFAVIRSLHKGWLYATADYVINNTRLIFRSSNAGANWEEIKHPEVGGPARFENFYVWDTILFASGYKQRQDSLGKTISTPFLFRSADQGMTWEEISEQFDPPGSQPKFAIDNRTLYLFDEVFSPSISDRLPLLYYSNDGGNSWKSILCNIPFARNMFFTGLKIYISSEYGTYVYNKPTAKVTSGLYPLPLDISVVPNPANDHIAVNFAAPSPGIYKFRIYDMNGKQLLSFPSRIEIAGQQSMNIEVEHLTSGVYTLLISNGHYSDSTPLIIQK